MKLFVYSYRTFDEDVYFREFSKEYGVELGICHQGPSMEMHIWQKDMTISVFLPAKLTQHW